jgi:hypothetical protein
MCSAFIEINKLIMQLYPSLFVLFNIFCNSYVSFVSEVITMWQLSGPAKYRRADAQGTEFGRAPLPHYTY